MACLQALGIESPPEPEPITLVDDLRNPTRLTLDQNNVYVVESVFGAVTAKKVPLQGGIPIVIATVSSCTSLGLAVDNTSVYWAGTCGSGGGEIVKAPLTGGTPTFLAGANQPSDIAIDDSFVYWAEDNGGPEETQAVRKVSSSGGAVQTVTPRGVHFPPPYEEDEPPKSDDLDPDDGLDDEDKVSLSPADKEIGKTPARPSLSQLSAPWLRSAGL